MVVAQFEIVILNERFLRSEGSGRAARSAAFFAAHNRAFGSLPLSNFKLNHYQADFVRVQTALS
jgi:hypothetical protein